MKPEEAEQICKLAAVNLTEHFEACQILATYTENGQTFHVMQGVGNWYARQGMAHEFINKDVAQENAYQISERLKEKE